MAKIECIVLRIDSPQDWEGARRAAFKFRGGLILKHL